MSTVSGRIESIDAVKRIIFSVKYRVIRTPRCRARCALYWYKSRLSLPSYRKPFRDPCNGWLMVSCTAQNTKAERACESSGHLRRTLESQGIGAAGACFVLLNTRIVWPLGNARYL